METLCGEDSVIFGDESVEENYTSAGEDLVSEKKEKEGSSAVGSSVVGSLKSTVKSALGFLPAVTSLGGKAEPSEGADSRDSHEVINKEAHKVSKARGRKEIAPLLSNRDNQPDEEVSDEVLSPSGTLIGGTVEGWSMVGPPPEETYGGETRLEAQSKDIHGQEEIEVAEEEEARAGDVVEEEEAGARAGEVTEDKEVEVRAGEVVEEEEAEATPEEVAEFAPESSPESESSRGFTSSEPEIQEEPSPTVAPPSSFPDNQIERPVFSYSDKQSSLRRRLRSSFKAGEGSSCSVDLNNSMPPEKSEIPAFRERQKIYQSRNKLGSRVSEDTKGKSQLQEEDSDTVSEVVNEQPLGRTKEFEFHSGYDPELEDDDIDASSTSSTDADNGSDVLDSNSYLKGKVWEETGSSGKLEEKEPASEMMHRREMYRMPDNDVEGEDNEASQSLLNPVGFVVQVVGFQLRLVVHAFALSLWLCNFFLSVVSHPINSVTEVKDRTTGAANEAIDQWLGLVSSVRGGVSQTGPAVSKISKKTLWGCLGAAYVMFMLTLLLVPALFLDLVIVNSMVEDPVDIRKTLDFDYTQPRPSALFPLFSPTEVERVKNLSPEKMVSTRVVPMGHRFHITAILTLPESEYNLNLGMFQVTTELLSARNQVLLRSSKPCMLRFSSSPVRLAKTMLYSIPLLMGFSTEAQRLEIRVLEAQEKVTPTASIRISLEPKAGYNGGGGVPELYEAELHLQSALPWPKSTMRNWKWTFYVWNGLCLFLFEVSLVLCCCHQVLIPGLGGQRPDEELVEGEANGEKSSRDNISSRKSKGKRRVYFEDGIPGAAGTKDLGHTVQTTNEDEADVPPLEETLASLEESIQVTEETVKKL